MGILPTDRFRAQHQDIEAIVLRIEAVFTKSAWTARALEIRLGFGELSEKLRLHLALEDGVFYPRLARHPIPAVRLLAQKHQTEIGGFWQDYENFLDQWIDSGEMLRDAQGFKVAATDLLAALKDRIHLENTEIYPLVETMGETAASH